MSPCLYGSEKRIGAPSFFLIETGALCSLLGVEGLICPLLDKIPTLTGSSWRSMIEGVLRTVLNVAVDLVTGAVDTESFCSMAPPPLPAEITYADVFQFIASYVPPLSFVTSGDGLLGKITGLYLYEKWFEYCECKKRDFLPEPYSQIPIPPFVGVCDAARARSVQVNALIDATNNENSVGDEYEYGWVRGTVNGAPTYEIENNEFQNLRYEIEGGEVWEIIDVYDYAYPNSQGITTIQFGCLKVESRGGDRPYRYTQWRLWNIEQGYLTDILLGYRIYNLRYLAWDESDCCPVDPPPPTSLPLPPANCVPTPPPRFCELFPDDPLCSNVPSCPECPPGGDCEVTEIEVERWICISGIQMEITQWKL